MRKNTSKLKLSDVHKALELLYQSLGGSVTIVDITGHLGRSHTAIRRKLRVLSDVGAAIPDQEGKPGVCASYIPGELTAGALKAAEVREGGRWDARYKTDRGPLIGACVECKSKGVEVSVHKGGRICRDCLCGGYGPTPVPCWTRSPMADF